MLLTTLRFRRSSATYTLLFSVLAAGCATKGQSTDPTNKAPEGSLTKEEVEGVIRANVSQIKACYERHLQGKRNLQGRVLSAFVIGADGRVSKSEVAQSTLGSPETEQCISEAITHWQFPVPRGGGVVKVRYPFVLQPK